MTEMQITAENRWIVLLTTWIMIMVVGVGFWVLEKDAI